MTSKEALKDILGILMNFEHIYAIDDTYDVKKQRSETIKKDLDLLEEYRKTEKEIGVDFITLVKMLKDDVYIDRMNKEASPHTIDWEVEERKD